MVGKPGERIVSDVVVLGDVPAAVRRNMELWVGCIAGALRDSEYVTALTRAGFDNVSVEPWRVYRAQDAKEMLFQAGITAQEIAAAESKFASAFVRATKPDKQKSCCGPECCA